MEKLALFGGVPVLPCPLPVYNTLGEEEAEAVADVVRSGCLSGFYGSWGEQFGGGPMVRRFEAAWAERFGVAHAVSVNSATSGLYAAMGAIGIQSGDEVIVPPYTMSATALAPLIYGGIPVFADVELETFCIDVQAVEAAITPRTRAIIAVNLFGHPAKLAELRALADKRGLFLIEDNAQAPLAMENGRLAGTIGHIGVFSLNYHKHIHAGEGGVCVTNDTGLALKLQLIRNHGENVVEPIGLADITNMIGFNYRMTELSAAVGLAQLGKIDRHVAAREHLACRLIAGLSDLPGLTVPATRSNCRHVFYALGFRYDAEIVGVSREHFSNALTAEGFPNFLGYVRPLYLLPIFQQRVAFGSYPFSLSSVTYPPGLCPVAEHLYSESLLGFENCATAPSEMQIDLLIAAIRKVHRLVRVESGE